MGPSFRTATSVSIPALATNGRSLPLPTCSPSGSRRLLTPAFPTRKAAQPNPALPLSASSGTTPEDSLTSVIGSLIPLNRKDSQACFQNNTDERRWDRLGP